MTAVLTNERQLARDERKEQRLFVWMVVPLLIPIAVTLLLPLTWLVGVSFLDADGHISLVNYLTLFNQPIRLTYLGNTFSLAFHVTVLSAVLAYPVAYWLTVTSERTANICMVFIVVPLLTSVLVRTYAWLVILQRRGIANSMLLSTGVISEPLQLVYNYQGTVIGMIHVMLPYMILPLYASLKAVDQELIRASASLGASPARAFWSVTLPLSAPGLGAGCLLVFAMSLGFYITPAILGGGRVIVWAYFLEESVAINPHWGPSAAAGVFLLVLTLLCLLAARLLLRRGSSVMTSS